MILWSLRGAFVEQPTPKRGNMIANIILYVRDQQQSTAFYSSILGQTPTLNVPGMTEFRLSDHCVLGLMPEKGIKRLLGSALPDPEKGNGIPRVELYLTVDDPNGYHQRAIKNGAKELSPLQKRDWGDQAAYSMDQDGHVIAFAERITDAQH